MSKWTVITKPIASEIMYGVCKVIDDSQPIHSGNVRALTYFETKEEAEQYAARMNGEETMDA